MPYNNTLNIITVYLHFQDLIKTLMFGKQLKVSLKVQYKFIKQSSNHTPRNLPEEQIYIYEKTSKEYL